MFPFALLSRFFGSNNDRTIKKYRRIVKEVNRKEEEYSEFSDEQLKYCTFAFKERLKDGSSLDDILPDAFAVVREASKRVFGMRPFDVQLIGGLALHHGMIAEMKTGEGKTLVATLPIYLNALMEKGVHLITVNDYLAKRDSEQMSQLYGFLGLTTGCIVHGLSDRERKEAYAADITYGTNHEFGFDYLRDNMKFHKSDMVQRPFYHVVIDEVDSILVDEARTPLIISGPSEDSSEFYRLADQVISQIQDEDFEKDEKQRTVMLTEKGIERIESLLIDFKALKGNNLYDIHNISLVHHTMAALKAHKIFTRDVDYIVKDGKIVIIDEFTGRMMEGRRYSDGLHQAIEAKEHVEVENENQTLASVTYQNFFRLYPKLSGMTGTAATEAAEFEEIYNLQVLSIPTNVPVQRKDLDDEVYLTNREKYTRVIQLIQECHAKEQPVLVGTTSIERSETLHELLKKERIPHSVLNARYHEQEASIIAEAGRPGAVTIATNMAGRGTDIKLGGNLDMRLRQELEGLDKESDEYREKEEKIKTEIGKAKERVVAAGGLYIIGTERHESRRIDNQLRGRSGRQGDPGASKFFVSLEDDLMRRFGSDRLDSMLRRFGAKEGETISHPWVNRALARAQSRVEAYNFEMRKHLLKYDDVINDQRKIIYEQRLHLISSEDISSIIQDMRETVVEENVWMHMPEDALPDQWDLQGLRIACRELFNLDVPVESWMNKEFLSQRACMSRLLDLSEALIREKEERYGSSLIRSSEKNILLRTLDQHWKDHLLNLDHLRQGINLRSYAQNNPLNEYKREAFNLFQDMMRQVKANTISSLSHFETYIPDVLDIERTLNPDFDLEKLLERTPEWEDEVAFKVSEDLENIVPHSGPSHFDRKGKGQAQVLWSIARTADITFDSKNIKIVQKKKRSKTTKEPLENKEKEKKNAVKNKKIVEGKKTILKQEKSQKEKEQTKKLFAKKEKVLVKKITKQEKALVKKPAVQTSKKEAEKEKEKPKTNQTKKILKEKATKISSKKLEQEIKKEKKPPLKQAEIPQKKSTPRKSTQGKKETL